MDVYTPVFILVKNKNDGR